MSFDLPADGDAGRARAEADRRNAERQTLIEQRSVGERQIADLRDTARRLREEAVSVGTVLDQAMTLDGPDTWTGRHADAFRDEISRLRDDLGGSKMTSVRYSLENAALDCELRANAIQDQLPTIPALVTPRHVG